MKHSALINRLQNLINRIPTQAELCKVLNIKQSTMGNRQARDSEFTPDEITKLEHHYNVLLSDRNISVLYFPDILASCGNGIYELSTNKVEYQLPATLFPPHSNNKQFSMCHARGNSMYPLIWDNDFVVIEHNTTLENGGIYIFCYDDQIYIKRLTKNINQIVVESENPEFPTQYIEKEFMNNVHIIGKVLFNGRYIDNFNETKERR